jgi:uncharacterized protein HemX
MGVTSAIAAVAALAYSVDSGEKARSDAHQARDQALANQQKQEAQADQAMNAANPQRPDTKGLLSQLQQAAKGGPSGTMLTGPQGVDPNTLDLGKSTLLGS